MKNFIKIFLAIVIMVTMFSFSSVQNAEASVSSEVSISANQNWWFNIVRVVENGKNFLYIYTEGGIYITKVEEL